MARFVGPDVSQKLTAICIVDETGRRVWRGRCATDPGQIERIVRVNRAGFPGGLSWSCLFGQLGGLVKLGSGCRQAASLSISVPIAA